MRAKLFSALVLCFFIFSTFALAVAEEKEEAKHDYIGAKKCKICHRKDGTYETWEATLHATAWDKLTDEQKKNKDIIPYYSTGEDKKGKLLEGVQCEACHGPGSDYKSKSIMEDREKAIANGLLIPDEETCKKCHHADAPTEALAASAKDFSYDKLKEKGVHALPSHEEKAEKKK